MSQFNSINVSCSTFFATRQAPNSKLFRHMIQYILQCSRNICIRSQNRSWQSIA